MTLINTLLGTVHANDYGEGPLAGKFLVRDLRNESRQGIRQLLDFFSNDLT